MLVYAMALIYVHLSRVLLDLIKKQSSVNSYDSSALFDYLNTTIVSQSTLTLKRGASRLDFFTERVESFTSKSKSPAPETGRGGEREGPLRDNCDLYFWSTYRSFSCTIPSRRDLALQKLNAWAAPGYCR